MVAADIVGNVAVENVGQDERGGTVSCGLISPSRSRGVRRTVPRTYNDRVHALWKRTRHGRLLSRAAAKAMREWRKSEEEAESDRVQAPVFV